MRRIKLVVFDMDGVLADIRSSWEHLHSTFDVSGKHNLGRYLRGEIDYKEFMRRDIALWGTMHVEQVKHVLDQVPLVDGAKETTESLRKEGIKTAIISAGVSLLAERLKQELGIDYAFANRLVVGNDGLLTGEGEEAADLLDKASLLSRLAERTGLHLSQCAVVGDSVFDIPLFEKAGLSIAFNATDERVKRAANIVIDAKDLRRILPHILRDPST